MIILWSDDLADDWWYKNIIHSQVLTRIITVKGTCWKLEVGKDHWWHWHWWIDMSRLVIMHSGWVKEHGLPSKCLAAFAKPFHWPVPAHGTLCTGMWMGLGLALDTLLLFGQSWHLAHRRNRYWHGMGSAPPIDWCNWLLLLNRLGSGHNWPKPKPMFFKWSMLSMLNWILVNDQQSVCKLQAPINGTQHAALQTAAEVKVTNWKSQGLCALSLEPHQKICNILHRQASD